MNIFRDKRREEELLKVAEQAAEWLITIDEEAGPTERAAFAEWLEESPLHVEMLLRATAVNRLGAMLDPDIRRRLENVTLTAAGTGKDSNIHLLETAEQRRPARKDLGTRDRRRWTAGIGIAAGVAALAAGLWLYASGALSWQHYETGVGEQRSVTLNDGSVMYLNADSRVAIRYDHSAREVDLASGEAMFKVVHDPGRPFRVHTDDAVVQAVGTQFDVYRKPTQTTVAVIEGVVQISRNLDRLPANPLAVPASPAWHGPKLLPKTRPERLSAGQAVVLAADGEIAQPVRINIAQVTAWRQRRLVFEWETLETIAAEFNRYNRTQIHIKGDLARQRKYTAVFDANEPQTLLEFLAKDGDLVFTVQGDELIIRKRQDSGSVASQELSAKSQ